VRSVLVGCFVSLHGVAWNAIEGKLEGGGGLQLTQMLGVKLGFDIPRKPVARKTPRH